MDCNCCNRQETSASRRDFLQKSAFGFGSLALGYLLRKEGGLKAGSATSAAGYDNSLGPRTPSFRAPAKNVIFLFMKGGPSHMDTFDPKPELDRFDGQLLPPSFQSQDLNLQFITASQSSRHSSYQPRVDLLRVSPWRMGKTYQPSNQGTSVFPHLSPENGL